MDKTKKTITLKHERKYCRPFNRQKITILPLKQQAPYKRIHLHWLRPTELPEDGCLKSNHLAGML
jgi:hypothetical protein